jgi:hypothetical protein
LSLQAPQKDATTSKPKPKTASLGWALRRALFGFVAMMTIVMLSAWLLYSSIDPDEALAAGLNPAQEGQSE